MFKGGSVVTDERVMDYTPPRQNVLSRIRQEQVIRRVERQAFGFSTTNFHRNQRLHRLAFALLSGLAVFGLLALVVL